MSPPSNDEPAFPHGSDDSGFCSGLTKREYAAIHLRWRDSGCEELDRMIHSASLREAFVLAGPKGMEWALSYYEEFTESISEDQP